MHTVSRLSLLALALGSMPLVAAAQTNTLYGDIRYSYNHIDNGVTSTTSGENNASRIGLKGETEIVDGLSGFYHFQAGVNIDGAGDGDAFTQRFFLAGLKGSFGKLTVGRTSTPYKMAGLKLDPFYDTSAGKGLGGATYGLSGLTNSWTDNTIAYSSNKMGDFTFNAGVYLDDSDADEHDTNFGIAYSNKSFTGGIQYLNIGDTAVVGKSMPDSTALRVHGQYKQGPWSIGASYETIDPSMGDSQKYLYVSTTYQLNKKTKLAASYGDVSDASAASDGSGVNLGAFYSVLKGTTVYVLYSKVNADDDMQNDRDTLALGLSYKFSF